MWGRHQKDRNLGDQEDDIERKRHQVYEEFSSSIRSLHSVEMLLSLVDFLEVEVSGCNLIDVRSKIWCLPHMIKIS